jgi:hypothetical protein
MVRRSRLLTLPVTVPTPLESERDRASFILEQSREIKTNIHAYRHYLDIAHTYLERDASFLSLYNLPDPKIRHSLREIALHRAAIVPSVEVANDLLILSQIERYFAGNEPDTDFFDDAARILRVTYPNFVPILRFRQFEQQWRLSPPAPDFDLLFEAASQLRFAGDLTSYYDCVRRIANRSLMLGDVDTATGMLLSVVRNLWSHGLVTDERIRVNSDPYSQQLGLISRALSEAYIRRARLETSSIGKRSALTSALEWNRYAHRIYTQNRSWHGIANTLVDRGEIAQQLEEIEETKYSGAWTWFLRAAQMFKKVGDEHHEAEARDRLWAVIGRIQADQPAYTPDAERALKDISLELWQRQVGVETKDDLQQNNTVDLDVRKVSTEFDDRTKPAGYIGRYGGKVDETAEFHAVADQEGFSTVELRAIIDKAKATKAEPTTGETTGRAPVEPRPVGRPRAGEVREARDKARLGILEAEFREGLDKMRLPPGGFTTQAEADAGARLGTTLRELQKLQRKLNLPVTETPERVKLAEAMASAYRRSHDKETGELIAPRGPGGRPRRWSQTGSPST